MTRGVILRWSRCLICEWFWLTVVWVDCRCSSFRPSLAVPGLCSFLHATRKWHRSTPCVLRSLPSVAAPGLWRLPRVTHVKTTIRVCMRAPNMHERTRRLCSLSTSAGGSHSPRPAAKAAEAANQPGIVQHAWHEHAQREHARRERAWRPPAADERPHRLDRPQLRQRRRLPTAAPRKSAPNPPMPPQHAQHAQHITRPMVPTRAPCCFVYRSRVCLHACAHMVLCHRPRSNWLLSGSLVRLSPDCTGAVQTRLG